MAKANKATGPDGQDWSAPAAELLAELPADCDGLLAAAVAAVVEIDAAVMRGDGAAAELAGDRYEAIIWKLNGGTNFGCMADDEAAGRVIERHCAAVPGDVPLWGQRGQFLAVAGDVRALVEYEAGYGGPLNAHFQFHAVDLDRPFISATGYRSHFDTARGCMTVDEVARGILTAMLAEKKRPVLIEANYRDRLADAPLPDWLAGLVPPARREPATVTIPPGFVLVDVVLPAHKAFIARRWAAEAAGKVKAARARSNAKGKPGAASEIRIGGNGDALQHRQEWACQARADLVEFTPAPGQRCEIVSVHHPVFAKEIGKRVIIVKVHPDTRQVWAHDDRPVTYKTNRAGRRVVDSDPSCIQSIYGFDQLRLIT
nr:klcB protein - Enterobacter aerogenes plasmid R751 [Klebsiella aerogenes]